MWLSIIVTDFFCNYLPHEESWGSNTGQPGRVNVRLERITHFVLLRWASWEFSSLFPWLVSHLGDFWETVSTQVPRCSGCLGSKQKGKRLLMIFVEVTFAFSLGEYIQIFVRLGIKALFFLSFKKNVNFSWQDVYLNQISGCMNLSADFCYVPCVGSNKCVGLKAASDPGVMKILIVRAWEKYRLSVFQTVKIC